MWKFIKKYFESKTLAEFEADVVEINLLEEEIKKLDNAGLLLESQKLQNKVKNNGASLDDVKIRAFALVREAARSRRAIMEARLKRRLNRYWASAR